MTPTAHDVVADYLKHKAETDKPAAAREAVAKRTREIVDELPDGFTRKDVGVCVNALLGDDEATDLSASQRSRHITKTLAEMVADGVVKLDGTTYSHPYPRPVVAR